jgi:hypothetical protein
MKMKFNELSQELQELWTRGVDHGVFNEDWAMMGGVVFTRTVYGAFYDDQSRFVPNIVPNLRKLLGRWCDGEFIMIDADCSPILSSSVSRIEGHSHLVGESYVIRMATPSECAEAGIDYVPFMGWRDIESVPKNVSVLTRTKGGVGIGSYEQNLRQTHWMPLPLV